MALQKFYSESERLSYNPVRSIPGFKWHNKIFSFDDRFITVKKYLDKLVKKVDKPKIKLLDIGIGDAVYESMLDKESLKGEMVRSPEAEELDVPFNLQLITEFYSR